MSGNLSRLRRDYLDVVEQYSIRDALLPYFPVHEVRDRAGMAAAITMASSDLSTASSSFTAYPGSIKGQYRTMNSLVTPGSSAARAREEEKKLKKAQEMIKRIREGKGGGK